MLALSTLGLGLLKAIQIRRGLNGAESKHLVYTNPLVMLLIVAAEELLFRSVLVGLLSVRIGLPLAIAASALIFFLLHRPNGTQSVLTLINSVLFTVVTSLLYVKQGYLAALGFHWGWNLTQWTVLGYPMYGRPVGRWLHVVPTGPVWLTGAEYGPEKSLFVAIVQAVGAVVLVLAW